MGGESVVCECEREGVVCGGERSCEGRGGCVGGECCVWGGVKGERVVWCVSVPMLYSCIVQMNHTYNQEYLQLIKSTLLPLHPFPLQCDWCS